MKPPISPWTDYAETTSPNEMSIARFHDGMEIAMGAPTRGVLTVISKSKPYIVSSDAASSMVWSDDSQLLAFSEWTSSRKQNLCVYRVADSTIIRSPDEFIVLELHTFSDGRISGVDSPAHMPRSFSLSFNDNAI